MADRMTCLVIDAYKARTAFSCYVKPETTDEQMLDLTALFALAMSAEIYYMERTRILRSYEPLGQQSGVYAHVYNLVQAIMTLDGDGLTTIWYPAPLDETVDVNKDIIMSNTKIVNLLAGLEDYACDEEGNAIDGASSWQVSTVQTGRAVLAAAIPLIERAGMDCLFYSEHGADVTAKDT